MLGLTQQQSEIRNSMITTGEYLIGFEITSVLGVVGGLVEKSFSSMAVGGVGFIQGCYARDMLSEAKQQMIQAATDRGANAIVGLRYALMGRELEKCVMAYGTAVLCKKLSA